MSWIPLLAWLPWQAATETAAAPANNMTIGGWLMMIVSLTFVWGLAIWCYRKILNLPPKEN